MKKNKIDYNDSVNKSGSKCHLTNGYMWQVYLTLSAVVDYSQQRGGGELVS